MGTGDVELFPSDAKLTVDTIAELQEENERLKRLSKEWLEEKKTLSDKLKKIEQIVNSEVDPNICNNVGDVRKVQAIKQIVNNYDGSIPSMICQFTKIQRIFEKE